MNQLDPTRLMEELERLHREGQHRQIVEQIAALPEEARSYPVALAHARALNSLVEPDSPQAPSLLTQAHEVLSSVRDEGWEDPRWNYQMGYCLYYLERGGEALFYLRQASEQDPENQVTARLLFECEHRLLQQVVRPKYYQWPEAWAAIEDHIQASFGISPNVFRESGTGDIRVNIHIIPPNEERPFFTLVTMGMGAYHMNVPESQVGEPDRLELVLTLPPDWNLNIYDEEWRWPLALLREAARVPLRLGTWLGWGHTVDHGQPYASTTGFCGCILDDPIGDREAAVCLLPDGDEVQFYQLIPLYREELDFCRAAGPEALLGRLAEAGELYHVVDIERPSVAAAGVSRQYVQPLKLKLNMRLQPVHLQSMIEMMSAKLREAGLGEAAGGQVETADTGEVIGGELFLRLKDTGDEGVAAVERVLDGIGIPVGSELSHEGLCRPVGKLQGLALYLNGTELAAEVYQNCDIDTVISRTEVLMRGVGRLYSFWSGRKNTALYFYGSSYEAMLAAAKPFWDSYPLCEKCVIVQIA